MSQHIRDRELARFLRTLSMRQEQVFGDHCFREMEKAYQDHGIMPNMILPGEKAKLQKYVLNLPPLDYVECPRCKRTARRIEREDWVAIFCVCVKEEGTDASAP